MKSLLWTYCSITMLGLTLGERYTLLNRWGLNQNFDIVMKEVYQCADPGSKLVDWKIDKVFRINRLKLGINGKFTLKEGFSDDLQMSLSIASQSGGVWIENYFNTKPGPACKIGMTLFPKLFTRIFKNAGHGSCPVPPGNYTFKGLDFTPDLRLPVIPLNKYKARVIYGKNNVRIGCLELICDVVEKKQ